MEIVGDHRFSNYKKFIACRKENEKSIRQLLSRHKICDYHLVIVNSKEYFRKLAECKYLFNNSTLPTYFIKKEEQIYINTWHGTPLKTLGRSILTTPGEIGNTQRNFFMTDYLLYPNMFTFEHMREDFMLNQLFCGKYIIGGYPRNQIFYAYEKQKQIREELGLNTIEVICYMPTWRGTMDNKSVEEQIQIIDNYLKQIDTCLTKEQLLFVNLHNFVKKSLDFNKYKRIKSFPDGYETYEFLSIADCLITDYSSVFFDFANTRRKIILFAYDQKDYFSTRGTYFSID